MGLGCRRGKYVLLFFHTLGHYSLLMLITSIFFIIVSIVMMLLMVLVGQISHSTTAALLRHCSRASFRTSPGKVRACRAAGRFQKYYTRMLLPRLHEKVASSDPPFEVQDSSITNHLSYRARRTFLCTYHDCSVR